MAADSVLLAVLPKPTEFSCELSSSWKLMGALSVGPGLLPDWIDLPPPGAAAKLLTPLAGCRGGLSVPGLPRPTILSTGGQVAVGVAVKLGVRVCVMVGVR